MKLNATRPDQCALMIKLVIQLLVGIRSSAFCRAPCAPLCNVKYDTLECIILDTPDDYGLQTAIAACRCVSEHESDGSV